MTTATLYEWRCGNCPPDAANPPPLLGLVTVGGGVYLHQSGHRKDGTSLNACLDVRLAPLVMHCWRCHQWRRLISDATGIHEEAGSAPAIAITCACTQQPG